MIILIIVLLALSAYLLGIAASYPTFKSLTSKGWDLFMPFIIQLFLWPLAWLMFTIMAIVKGYKYMLKYKLQ